MGAQITKKQTQLRVANLNFSGFKRAPFQFYSAERYDEEEELGRIFIQEFQKYKIQEARLRKISSSPSKINVSKAHNINNSNHQNTNNQSNHKSNQNNNISNSKSPKKQQPPKKQSQIKIQPADHIKIQSLPFLRSFDSQNQNIAKKRKLQYNVQFTPQLMSTISKIDHYVKEQRYSPLYNKKCGVNDGKLIDYQVFQQLWYKTLKQNQGWVKIKPKSKQQPYSLHQYNLVQQQHKKQLYALLVFDYLVYQSMLFYVYDKRNVNTIVEQRSCSKYIGFIQSFFQKPSMNHQKKIVAVLQFLQKNNIDILFMQEATQKFCNQLQTSSNEYRFIRSTEQPNDPGVSLIVFKQKSFEKANIGRKGNIKLQKLMLDKQIKQQQRLRLLNWGKTAIISIDNFILISAQCDKHTQQINQDLRLIRQKLPSKYIIVGASIHKQIELTQLNSNFQVFPKNKITTLKKRNYLQLQQAKSNQFIAIQNQFIFYDIRLNLKQSDTTTKVTQNSKVVTLDLKQINENPVNFNKLPVIDQTNIEDNNLGVEKKRVKNIKKQNDKLEDQLISRVGIGMIPNQTHFFEEFIVFIKLKIPKKIDKYQNKTLQQRKKIRQDRERLGFETSSSEEEDQRKNNKQQQKLI